MSTMKQLKPYILIALMALGLLATACSPSAEKLNNEGNETFAEELYIEALATYQSAQFESPELAEPYYNAANALYREGAYPEALEQMLMALQFAEEESLAESSFYNLGNSLFNTQDLESAIAAYTEALLINPADFDAKYNLELALQQQEQEQQEQEEQEQDQSEEGDQGEEQQDQSQGGEDQQEQEQDQQGENGEEEQQDQNQDGEGQPQDGQEEGDQPGQVPPPGQRMTEEQARQLLEGATQDGKTLQGELNQIYVVPPSPPVQDW